MSLKTNETETSSAASNFFPAVEKISTKLPSFWEEVPEVWFVQAEAEFEISRVTQERTRYSYLISALPKETLAKVLDIIKAPHPEQPYTHLKEQILARLSSSEETRLSKLLYHVEIGDRTPSDFFRHMVQLAGYSTDLSVNLIQKLWKSRLPKQIEIALIAVDTKEHAEQLKIADRLWECTQSNGIAQVEQNNNSELSEMRREIGELREMLKGLNTRGRSNSRSRGEFQGDRSPSRSGSRQRQYATCWYHYRFGKNAKKCIQPCNFTTDDDQKN
ncbi:uncharacterized protein LOC128276543 [Anopheles cruzii]|uniref:uncharacterized protein LOC128276543 n=1 Tax=Anopheles cruzii TaxID=68878 RepID=UPI0022EC3826|nr:uncharacterized protein LOC128276543 [Anopheles cruzii]